MCVLCKYWLGPTPEIDYISGKGSVENVEAMCSQDGRNHRATTKCRFFEKCLTYL